MQKIHYIFSPILIVSLFFFQISSVNTESNSSFTNKNMYSLYEQRVKSICDNYKYKKNWSSEKIKFVTRIYDEYEKFEEGDLNYNFKKIQNTHRNNMNNIYKCGLLSVQKKSLELIKKDLLNHNLSLKIYNKIDSKLNQIKYSFVSFNCINSNQKDGILKVNVLHQATYQTCKYVSYLEYIKEYNSNFKNLLKDDLKQNLLDYNPDPNVKIDAKDMQKRQEAYDKTVWNIYSSSHIMELQKEAISKVDEEIQHTYKVFPLAYQAYAEYENNVTAHFLLELLREDYIVFKEKLHDVLNPMNQIVYKISNAMKK